MRSTIKSIDATANTNLYTLLSPLLTIFKKLNHPANKPTTATEPIIKNTIYVVTTFLVSESIVVSEIKN